jgi:hypothetical protein
MASGSWSLIAEKAYFIWQNGGCREGGSIDDWLQAEAEVMHASARTAEQATRKGSARRGSRKVSQAKA